MGSHIAVHIFEYLLLANAFYISYYCYKEPDDSSLLFIFLSIFLAWQAGSFAGARKTLKLLGGV